MTAALIEVADAITTELNDDPRTNFGVGFTAERSYPDFAIPLEDIGELRVDVVPKSAKPAQADRAGNTRYVVMTQIVLRKRFSRQSDGKLPPEDMDELIEVLEKIFEFFVPNQGETSSLTLSAMTQASYVGGDIPAPYITEDLQQKHQYTGICEVAFEVVR